MIEDHEQMSGANWSSSYQKMGEEEAEPTTSVSMGRREDEVRVLDPMSIARSVCPECNDKGTWSCPIPSRFKSLLSPTDIVVQLCTTRLQMRPFSAGYSMCLHSLI